MFKQLSVPGIDDFDTVLEDDIVAALPFLKERGVPYYSSCRDTGQDNFQGISITLFECTELTVSLSLQQAEVCKKSVKSVHSQSAHLVGPGIAMKSASQILWNLQGNVRHYKNWENARPPQWERRAIKLLIELLKKDTTTAQPGFSIHIAHMSDTGSLPAIQQAKQQGRATLDYSLLRESISFKLAGYKPLDLAFIDY